MNLVLMGPPGSGKGTQAARVAQARGVPVIATGDTLRRTALAATSMGRAVTAIMEQGELVDDEMMIEILSERVAMPDAQRGFVLDGFPRTVNQGLALDVLMENRGPVIVVELTVPHDELIRRLGRRLVCRRCGTTASLEDRGAGSCHCGGAFQVRLDDNEAVAGGRLRVYERASRPLVDFYRKRPTFSASMARCRRIALRPKSNWPSTRCSKTCPREAQENSITPVMIVRSAVSCTACLLSPSV